MSERHRDSAGGGSTARMDRRDFLQILGTSAAAFGLSAPAFSAIGRSRRSRRPNIVLIMADDMGFSDLGCYGSEISTPNLDNLARGGVRFTQFYNCARCCPSRASLLTGLYPHQAGIGHMVGNKGLPAYQGYLNDRCVTIAEAIRRGGYHALMAGKWHVGEKRPHWPLDRGFEQYWGLISGACSYFETSPGRTMAHGNTPFKVKRDGFYMTDAITDHALEQIEAYAGKPDPFFIYIAYTAPHWPLHALREDIEKYRGKYDIGWDELRARRHRRMVEMGIVKKEWELTPRDRRAPAWTDAKHKEWFSMRMAVYAAQIDRLDQNIGRIMAKLRQLGLEENTLVMFLADNGGCAEELRGNKPDRMPGPPDTFMSYGLPWANASNTPFRLYKHWIHEGGISTPFIAYWPGVIRPGTMTDQIGHIIDLMPTCLDAAGVEYPKTYNGRPVTPVEGKSLLPIFRGKVRRGHDALFWEHEGNRGVRQGKWKLVSKYPNDWELHDMEAARTEMHDLAKERPEKVKELAALYDRWAKRCGVVPWETFRRKRRSGRRRKR